jgi:HlyD family secretion protein
MAKPLLFLLAAIVGAAAVLGLIVGGFVPGFARTTATPVAPTGGAASTATTAPQPTRVVALARLEPAGGIIELGGVPGDKVDELLVRAGQTVKKNDVLIRFESRTLRELEQTAARSQLTEATARLQAERKNADALVTSAQLAVESQKLDELELNVQRTRLKSLEASLQIARRDYDRLTKLDADITSPQELDHARLLAERAEIEFAAANEELKKLEQGLDLRRRQAEAGLTQAQAAREKVDAAVPLESLKVGVSAADERLRLAVLCAPFDGIVLETLTDTGDAVGPTPLLRLADTTKMIARAEVYETQVRSVRIGQKASITADALAKPLSGTVAEISNVVGHNRLVSLDPRRSTDDRIVEVRIQLDDPTDAARFVNLQTTVTIDVGGEK